MCFVLVISSVMQSSMSWHNFLVKAADKTPVSLVTDILKLLQKLMQLTASPKCPATMSQFYDQSDLIFLSS